MVCRFYAERERERRGEEREKEEIDRERGEEKRARERERGGSFILCPPYMSILLTNVQHNDKCPGN